MSLHISINNKSLNIVASIPIPKSLKVLKRLSKYSRGITRPRLPYKRIKKLDLKKKRVKKNKMMKVRINRIQKKKLINE